MKQSTKKTTTKRAKKKTLPKNGVMHCPVYTKDNPDIGKVNFFYFKIGRTNYVGFIGHARHSGQPLVTIKPDTRTANDRARPARKTGTKRSAHTYKVDPKTVKAGVKL